MLVLSDILKRCGEELPLRMCVLGYLVGITVPRFIVLHLSLGMGKF